MQAKQQPQQAQGKPKHVALQTNWFGRLVLTCLVPVVAYYAGNAFVAVLDYLEYDLGYTPDQLIKYTVYAVLSLFTFYALRAHAKAAALKAERKARRSKAKASRGRQQQEDGLYDVQLPHTLDERHL